MKKCLAVVLLLLVLAVPVQADESIWIEGEDATSHSFNRHGWYSNSGVDKSVLSGGEWLGHYDESDPAEAHYFFRVEEGGTYSLWLRCNPFEIEHEITIRDHLSETLDPKNVVDATSVLEEGVDIRRIGWFEVGECDLSPGRYVLTIRVEAGPRESHGGIDALTLVNFPWTPDGTARPEVEAGAASGGDAPAGGAGDGTYVWVEGEKPARHNFNQHGWYSGSNVNRELLSGGDWLAHYDSDNPATAEYHFTIPEAGTYTGWLRLNPRNKALYCALDGGSWEPVPLDDVRERNNLLSQGIDIRSIGWVRLGSFDFDAGRHSIAFRVEAENGEAHTGIDCLTFVGFPWAPSGLDKPEPAEDAGPDTWFPFYPGDDEFSEDSIIDMTPLIEQRSGIPAGKHGFVQRDGDRFVFSDRPEEPVKFWGTCASPAANPELQRQQARFYVKYGINLVRRHTVQHEVGLLQTDPQTGERRLDPDRLDKFDRWFAILKENGIYMCWSCFYPHIITPEDGYPQELYKELPDRGAGKSTSGVVNLMPQLQDAQWEWLETLLLHENPYTGNRYIDEPALAIVETHNEDCIFFHSPLNTLAAGDEMPRHTAILKRKWAEWLQERYGSDEALREAWGDGMRSGDSVDNENMDIYGAWQMGAEGPIIGENVRPRERQRMGDFIRFLAETQRSFYEQRERRLRELGYKGCTISTAWRAGGPAADPANIWADDAQTVISRHNYFGGGAGGHNIEAGEVNNESHMPVPGSRILSTGMYQVDDKPFMKTEWTQLPPNQWKAEAAPLFAFYGMGLQGWDASTHFAGSTPRFGSGWPRLRSYVTETPHYLGQFPALAFSIHNNHIEQAPPAAARRLKLEDIFQGIDALNQDFTGGGYDQKELTGNLATPKEVLAIGRVTLKIDEEVDPPEKVDWDRYWDKQQAVVESMTGDLVWDYGKKVVTVRSDKTQGIIGFAGGRSFELPALEADVRTPFVSLLFTPLDDKPLAESEHILITAMARDKQKGARYSMDGSELLDVGSPPLMMEPVQATLTLDGPPIESVRVVDIYGVPTDREVEREGNTFDIDGRYATYYYEVRR
ncbi:MAG: beta-galactosidase [Candidatus Brocadiia bacterium]